jgi:hypothetical protein
MKKKLIALSGLILMVMFFLADVRLDAGFHEDRKDDTRTGNIPDDLSRIRESNMIGIMGILLQVWARSMRNFFRTRTKQA